LIINDDKRRILYFNAGWPGSTHDDRVFQNSRIVEYIIGDSTYGPQNFMISTYKKPVGAPLHPDNEVFNTKMAKP
jgi:hypothetical protein